MEKTIYHYPDREWTEEDRAQWAEFLTAMNSGEEVEIDESIYWYFLEVLPPAFMPFYDAEKDRRCSFAFAEGWENVTAFWQSGKQYFCRRTNIMNPNR